MKDTRHDSRLRCKYDMEICDLVMARINKVEALKRQGPLERELVYNKIMKAIAKNTCGICGNKLFNEDQNSYKANPHFDPMLHKMLYAICDVCVNARYEGADI